MTTIDEIPVAHTPPGGYGDDAPPSILAGCTEPSVDGAPDLRGWWRTVEVVVDDQAQADHPGLGHVQRVEQAGDREVKRWRDGPDMMWPYLGLTARLELLGSPNVRPD